MKIGGQRVAGRHGLQGSEQVRLSWPSLACLVALEALEVHGPKPSASHMGPGAGEGVAIAAPALLGS